MSRYLPICGSCEAVAKEPVAQLYHRPKGWAVIGIKINNGANNDLFLCCDCCNKIGIDSEARYQSSYGDEVLEMIVEAVAERLQEV